MPVDQDLNEAKFLHDVSNPLAIAYGTLRLLVDKLEEDANAVPPALILEKLQKISKNFERANELLNARKNLFSSQHNFPAV